VRFGTRAEFSPEPSHGGCLAGPIATLERQRISSQDVGEGVAEREENFRGYVEGFRDQVEGLR
jgi:hypothetical protein